MIPSSYWDSEGLAELLEVMPLTLGKKKEKLVNYIILWQLFALMFMLDIIAQYFNI